MLSFTSDVWLLDDVEKLSFFTIPIYPLKKPELKNKIIPK